MSDERFVQDGKLEARVESTSQNAKGWYIRLLLHPSDTEEVTKLRVGAVLDIRWREVLNVEVEPIEVESGYRGHLAEAKREVKAHVETLKEPKPKQRFADLPLSQQCALLCDDPDFWKFLSGEFSELWERGTMDRTSDRAADTVRAICHTSSRSEFDNPSTPQRLWRTLHGRYQNWLTDKQYAGARR